MKGAIREPRTSGGAWSSRIDLGFDDAVKRRQRQVVNLATKREAQVATNETLAGRYSAAIAADPGIVQVTPAPTPTSVTSGPTCSR